MDVVYVIRGELPQQEANTALTVIHRKDKTLGQKFKASLLSREQRVLSVERCSDGTLL